MLYKSLKELEDKQIVNLSLYEKSTAFQVNQMEQFYNKYENKIINSDQEKRLWARLSVEIKQLLAYIDRTKKLPEYKLFSVAFKGVVEDIIKQYKDYKGLHG